MEITITKAKLTKSLFAQLPVLPESIMFSVNTECVGYFLNIKHPSCKSDNKIYCFKNGDKHFVMRDYTNWKVNQHRAELNYRSYFVRFDVIDNAYKFLDRFLELTKEKQQLFI